MRLQRGRQLVAALLVEQADTVVVTAGTWGEQMSHTPVPPADIYESWIPTCTVAVDAAASTRHRLNEWRRSAELYLRVSRHTGNCAWVSDLGGYAEELFVPRQRRQRHDVGALLFYDTPGTMVETKNSTITAGRLAWLTPGCIGSASRMALSMAAAREALLSGRCEP